jgi:MFS family permease
MLHTLGLGQTCQPDAPDGLSTYGRLAPRTSAFHYGWIILGAGTFGSFMTLPGQTAGVSVLFDPITADLGISRNSASIAYSVGALAGILPAPLTGRWIDRHGTRLTAIIIAGGLALACAFMAAVQSGTMLLIGFALLRGHGDRWP